MSGQDRPADETVASPSVVEIVVDENLDAAGSDRLRERLEEAQQKHPGRIVVDLSRCSYIDASGVGVLLDAHRRIWSTGGRLNLREPSARLQRLFRLSHLDRVLMVEPSPAIAPADTHPARP